MVPPHEYVMYLEFFGHELFVASKMMMDLCGPDLRTVEVAPLLTLRQRCSHFADFSLEFYV